MFHARNARRAVIVAAVLSSVPLLQNTPAAFAALAVTPSTNAAAMAQAIVGPNLSVSNVVYTGGVRTDNGTPTNASGFFTGGNSVNLGLDSGVILTSGNVNIAPGPNNSSSAGQDNGNPGDAQLSAIVSHATFDAAVLEFDVQSTTGKLFVKYVFASDEYPEFVGSTFNDVFAFLVDGSNIALIPGTNTPVSINTVNGGVTFPDNTGFPASNPTYFRDNNGSNPFSPSPTLNIQYDGLTTVLVAEIDNLGSGTHHLKLAVADTSDNFYDSAIFLGNVTATDPNLPSPEPSCLALLGTSTLALLARRRTLHPRNPNSP